MPKVLFLLAIGIAAAGCSSSSSSTAAAPAAASPSAAECKVDADCVCGTDKETHKCAFGPAARIDTGRQCPDFCTGIAGRMKIACVEGTCRQVKR